MSHLANLRNLTCQLLIIQGNHSFIQLRSEELICQYLFSYSNEKATKMQKRLLCNRLNKWVKLLRSDGDLHCWIHRSVNLFKTKRNRHCICTVDKITNHYDNAALCEHRSLDQEEIDSAWRGPIS